MSSRAEGASASVARTRGRATAPLVVSDACALIAAYALAAGSVGMRPGPAQVVLFACALVVWLLGMAAYGLYARPVLGEPRAVPGLGRIAVAATVGAWLWFGAARLLGSHPATPSQAYLFWALAIAFLVLGRVLTGALLRRRNPEPDTLVVLGSGPAARRIARKVRREPRYGVRVLGFAEEATTADGRHGGTPVLCAPHELPALVASHGIQHVVVAGSGASWPDVVADLRRAGVSVDVVPPLPEEVGLDGRLHGLEEVPLIALAPARRTRWSLATKRAVDVVLAGAALAALAPVFGFVAWRVRRTSPGPVFFRQARIGRHMREFSLLKFRTMWVDTPSDPHREYVRSISRSTAEPEDSGLYKLAREDAVTPTGRWLRRTSLDELPQLINVLRGDMSIVGPRPCLAHELECFEPRHYERFALPAGITGLWQVTARARATFDEALDFDVAYVRSWSLGLDLRILVRTPVEMLRPHQTA